MQNKLAVSTNTYHPYSLDDALRGISAAGFRYVELTAVEGWTEHVSLDLDAAGLRALQEKLRSHGLEACSLSAHSDLTTDHGVELAHKGIDLAAALGLTIMNTAVGGHASQEENKAAFMRNILPIAEHAARRGITIALEVHGDIMANGAKSVELIREINHPSVRINYDTANCMYYGDTRPEEDIKVALPYLAHCHLKDGTGGYHVWNFPPIGDGTVDFAAIIRTLREGGYTGPLSVEIEFTEAGWPDLEGVHAAVAKSYRVLAPLVGA